MKSILVLAKEIGLLTELKVAGCQQIATSTLSNVLDMSYMFAHCNLFNSNINNWNLLFISPDHK